MTPVEAKQHSPEGVGTPPLAVKILLVVLLSFPPFGGLWHAWKRHEKRERALSFIDCVKNVPECVEWDSEEWDHHLTECHARTGYSREEWLKDVVAAERETP